MIVFYHDADLTPYHFVTHAHDPRWWDWLKNTCAETWIEVPDDYRHGEIYLAKDASGVVTAHKLGLMSLECPSSIAKGQVIDIKGVPAGSTIKVNGAQVGVSDASGVLELEPNAPGTYVIDFANPAFLPATLTFTVRST